MSSGVPNLGPGLNAYFSVCLVTCFLVVGLRIWARLISKSVGLWWDDWLSILDLAIIVVYFALGAASIAVGLGKPSADLEPWQFRQILLLVYCNAITSFFVTVLPKVIALLFYARVFPAGSLPRSRLWIGHICSMIWLLYNTLVQIFQCRPIHKAWDFEVEGWCVNTVKWYIAAAAMDFAIDLYILLLPMPILVKLHMARSKKLLLVGLFIVGYLSAAISLARLLMQALIADKLLVDFSYTAIPNWYVVISEPIWSLVGVCLPAIFYLFQHAQRHGIKSLITLRASSLAGGDSQTRNEYSLRARHARLDSPIEHSTVYPPGKVMATSSHTNKSISVSGDRESIREYSSV